MWVVDRDGATWVRVANPNRAWYGRLRANPRVELVRGGSSHEMLAIPDESPESRNAIDAAFASKDGLVDRWYDLLVRRNPVPIRLVPAP